MPIFTLMFVQLPRSFTNAGMCAGCIMLIFAAFVTNFCNTLVVRTSVEVRRKQYEYKTDNETGNSDVAQDKPISYADLAELGFGAVGKNFVNVGALLVHVGYCCVYVDFALTNCKIFMDFLFPSLAWSLGYYIAIFAVMLSALVLVRDSTTVAKFASLGNYLILGSMAYLSIVCLIHVSRGEIVTSWSCPPIPHDISSACGGINLTKFPGFFGVSVYSFYSCSMVLPIRERMANKQDFDQIQARVMFVIGSMCLVTCILPMLAFGDSMKPVVFQTIDSEVTVQILMMAYSVIFIFSLLPMLLTPIDIVEGLNSLDSKEW